MKMNRRELLMSGAAAGAGAALGGPAAAQEKRPPRAVLRVSSQHWIIPGRDLPEKLGKMQAWGFDGVELGGDIVGKEKEYADALKNTRLKYSAVCWGSIGGALVSEDTSKRAGAAEEFKRMLAAAGEIGTTGVIYVPAFNGQTKLTNPEIRQVLLDTLPALGEYALQVKSRILLEPLNRGEAYFLRQVADGASICRDCKSDGVCMMGDFYHMRIEETSDFAAFVAAGERLHHVHLASWKRNLPGQDERDFRDGFKGLKYIGYQDFCSLECGVQGDAEVEIPKAVKFLRKQWSEA